MSVNTQKLLKGLSSVINPTASTKTPSEQEEELKNTYSLGSQVQAISSLNQEGQSVGGINLLGNSKSTRNVASLLNNQVTNNKSEVMELRPYLVMGALIIVALIVARG